MRVFLAVEIPDKVRAEIARLQDNLKSAGADVKWVEPRNLHLTLKFLGEIQEEKVPSLTDALRAAAAAAAPFSISLEGVGAFPRIQHPRVLWVGIKEGKEALERLAGAIEETCNPLGFPAEERAFSPHLTIGRIRSNKRHSALEKELQEISFHAGEPAAVDHLTLFQSVLSSRSPTYTKLAEIPFRRRSAG